jgi:hypothetical protein
MPASRIASGESTRRRTNHRAFDFKKRAAMPVSRLIRLASLAIIVICFAPIVAANAESREDAVARLKPFIVATAKPATAKPATAKPAAAKIVDSSTLAGKVMCGYQGWFTAEGDGAGRGWSHYGRGGRFEPGRATIDLWPDVSELDADEKFATPFRHADGSVAYVFSSHNAKTVDRHFKWMADYGIDGVFVQRFAVETFTTKNFAHCNAVLDHCRAAANAHGRAYAVMYDLSGLRRGDMPRVLDDWKLLVDRMKIGRDDADHAYLRHAGKPVVAVWGIGFNDNRSYTLDECDALIKFLKDDPKYGGNAVMLGVPTGWRTLDSDAVKDAKLLDIVRRGDIVSPWTVGRYAKLEEITRHADRRWAADIAWCREAKKEYLPVVFPGFSWHNMHGGRAPLDQIPRRGGEFLWKQFTEAKRAGATMVYQAMFDEMDEGTAIFKCTNDPPMGESRFLTSEPLPSDHYLWLVGQAARLVRGELDPSEKPPMRASEKKSPN